MPSRKRRKRTRQQAAPVAPPPPATEEGAGGGWGGWSLRDRELARLAIREILMGDAERGSQTRLAAALAVIGRDAPAATASATETPTSAAKPAEERQARVLHLVEKAMGHVGGGSQ